MILTDIGAFGHSIGARAVTDAVHAHPEKFQAAVALDMGPETEESLQPTAIPFMHQIAANRKIMNLEHPPIFKLAEHGYLVGITPNEDNHDYSLHMSFSDQSTLQYLPFYQSIGAYKKKWVTAGFDLTLLSHEPTEAEYLGFDKTTYVLIKMNNHQWKLWIYEHGKKLAEFGTEALDAYRLSPVLATLPDAPLDQLSEPEREPIKKLLTLLHSELGENFGTGNGWDITRSIDTYALQFFNTFLKGKDTPAFKNCTPLSGNTYMHCGPGNF